MGNQITCERNNKPRTIADLKTKVGEYVTINEGDPQMREDPEFPQKMMKDILDNNTSIEGGNVQGTYVFYPNKTKPKMWIGNYKIVNPEDILCKTVAEKIGLSEEEWRSHIKNRQPNKEGNKEIEESFNFDKTCELPLELKETLNRANVEYVTLGNNHTSYYEDSEFIQDPEILNQIYESMNYPEAVNYSINEQYIMNDYPVDEAKNFENVVIEEETEEVTEVEKKDAVTEVKEKAKTVKPKMRTSINNSKKPNKSISGLNVNKEKETGNKGNKELTIQPKITKNSVISPKNKVQRNIPKSVKPKKCDKKDVLAELINENKNKYHPKISTLNKKKKEGHANLAALNTKNNLEENQKVTKNTLSTKIVNKKMLVK